MKKSFGFAAAMILSAAMFVSCGSTKVVHEWIEEPTPENSVLVFGYSPMLEEFEVAQIDEKFSADYHSAVVSWGVVNLGFLQPGTEYQMIYGHEENGNYVYSNYTNLDVTVFNFKMPSKPGLHFIGSFSLIQSSIDKKLSPYKTAMGTDFTDQENVEKHAISSLIKKYKGTPWEPVLQKRFDELEAIINARK